MKNLQTIFPFGVLHDKYACIDYVKIPVTGKGPGFDNKYNEYIFDFVKKLNADTDSVGFGLSFCKRITENHFGTITAESATGAGATFIVRLPVDAV